IVTSMRPVGGSFRRPQTLSAPRSDSDEASLSVNSAGQAAVTWIVDTPGHRHFRIGAAFRDRPGKPFAKPHFLTPAGRDAFSPSIALDERGRALAVWAIPGAGDGFQVLAAVRPAGGPPGRPR